MEPWPDPRCSKVVVVTRGSRHDLPLEWVEEDPAPPRPPRRHRRYPFLFVAAAGLLVAVVALLPKGPAAPTAAPVQTSTAGQPLMAARPGWELIGRGAELVRIDLYDGRVTRTALPALQSTGPVYLVAGPDRVVIRPLDYVPGYVVPDGQPAQPLAGLLGRGGPAFPGPDGQHLWVDVDTADGRQMALVGFDGTPTGTIIRSPDTFPEAPDGTGYLVFVGLNGASLARPAGSTRITTGQLLAAGPTRWLTQECVGSACRMVVTDRTTGKARVLATTALANHPPPFPGPISPDGAAAALAEDSDAGPVAHLVELATGRDRSIARLPPSGGWDSMVWSPDSRALFFLDDLGALQVLDRASGQASRLGIALPPMHQLAFRVKPAP